MAYNQEESFLHGAAKSTGRAARSMFDNTVGALYDLGSDALKGVSTFGGTAMDFAVNPNLDKEANEYVRSQEAAIADIERRGVMNRAYDKINQQERAKVDKIQNLATSPELGKAYNVTVLNDAAEEGKKQFEWLAGMKQSGASKQQLLDELNKRNPSPADRQLLEQEINKLFPEDGPPKAFDATSPEVKQLANDQKNMRDGLGDDFGHVDVNSSQVGLNEDQLAWQSSQKLGNQIVTANATHEYWYQDDDFVNDGLMRMGLGILLGEDIGDAWKAASAGYQNSVNRKRRSAYTQELADMGYSQRAISDYIQSGKLDEAGRTVQLETATDAYGNVYQRNPYTQAVTRAIDAKETWKPVRGVGGVPMLMNQYGDVKSDPSYKGRYSAAAIDEGGQYQINLDTQKKEYIRDPKQLGTSGGTGIGGSDPTKNPFRSNAQAYMGSGTMQDAEDSWNMVYREQESSGGYGGDSTAGSLRRIFGGDSSAVGRTTNELSPTVRNAKAAEEGFLQAYGRILSGGAIKDEEWYSWGDTYFPRPGDSPKDKLRKQFLRQSLSTLVSDMYHSAGIDLEALPEDERKKLGHATKARVESQANRIFTQVVNYIEPSAAAPRGAYVLKDGSFFLPDRGIITKR